MNFNLHIHSQSLSDEPVTGERNDIAFTEETSPTATDLNVSSIESKKEETWQYRQVAVEVEPVAYILKGAGIYGRYQHNNMRYTVEVFGVEIPESLHGNEGFEASSSGMEMHVEYFFRDSKDGFFLGPEIGITNFEITHRESQVSRDRTQYGVGLRGGYRWYTGLGNLYLSPMGGIVYTLNSTDIEIEGEVYESGPVTPFVTAGFGWSFDL